MFDSEAFEAWLVARGAPGGTAYAHNHSPLDPDEITTITQTPGLPNAHVEEAVEIVGVQLKTRSARNAAQGARASIYAQDAIIMNDAYRPFSLAGKHVLDIQRHGGPPAFMFMDQRHRETFVCNYLITIQR